MPEGDLSLMEEILRALRSGAGVALCTVVDKKGSAPRDPGAKLAVIGNRVIGTLGGGEFERLVVEAAKEALAEGRPRLVKFSFHEGGPPDAVSTGHLCGGEAEVFIDVLAPVPRLIIVGSGHVSLPVARITSVLGWRLVIIDDNPSTATKERFPDAEEIRVGEPSDEIAKLSLSSGDLVFIAHGDAEKEYRVLKGLAGRRVRYIGLLGSRKKGAAILRRLKEEGADLSPLKGIFHVPAGLDIGSDRPEEIAVSVVAEMLAILKGVTPNSLSIADSVIESLERGENVGPA